MIGRNWTVATAAWLAFASVAAAGVLPPEAQMLAPHRAVYDLELGSTRASSTVSGVRGRLVFEFTGNVCEGFTQNMRFVMGVSNRDGGETMSDLRSTTWETPSGDKFRFSINDFQNAEQSDATSGSAERHGEKGVVDVSLAKPSEAKVALVPGTIFPVQHTIALLGTALRGGHVMAANLFDGSEKGKKASFTNSIIGAVRPASASPEMASIKNAGRLAGLRSWPVTIAYFDTDSAKAEGVPAHEMSFQFYENGVVGQLSIDYGTLSVKGTLAEIEFYPTAICSN
jgi:EipB-like